MKSGLHALLSAMLLIGAVSASGCKSQDPSILLKVTGQFRIPADADGLRVDIYDTSNNKLVVTQSFVLQAGTNFPYTVALVESGADHPHIKIIATATLSGSQVGVGDVEVQFRDGQTFNAEIDLAPTN